MIRRLIYTAAILLPAAWLSGCSDTADDIAETRAIQFSVADELAGRSTGQTVQSPPVFKEGDGIGVFACYRTPQEASTTAFTANFMRNQQVTFNGGQWSYDPIKYWPTNGTVEFRGYYPYDGQYNTSDNGLLTINHKCETALEPMYATHCIVTADNGSLSGNGMSTNGNLKLEFRPIVNKVNFTANVQNDLFTENNDDEYKDCYFLLISFKIWGFYRTATCEIDNFEKGDNGDTNNVNVTWSNQSLAYTRSKPLDLTQYLDMKTTADVVDGYVYDLDKGYCTEKAVVIAKDPDNEKHRINIFKQSLYFIPMDGIIEGNYPGFEVQYVVLTKKTGENEYKESGIVTRRGGLQHVFENETGLIKKLIHINLDFSHDGVTVTRYLEDYEYKPMF